MSGTAVVKHIVRESSVEVTSRVMQVCGLFDVQSKGASHMEWNVSLDLDWDWQVGLIVGASGSGKTTIANELFPKNVITGFRWSKEKSVVDCFPADLSIKQITDMLSRVGFSSPPSWLRPFDVLSTGEQFRATLARALCSRELVVMDEFTSVVDRTVAKIGSNCVSRVLRKHRSKAKRFVGVSCHYDIIDWLQPDWLYEPMSNSFTRRDVQRRPHLKIELSAVDSTAWKLFAPYHYLTAQLNKSARCFCTWIEDQPAGFIACIPLVSGTTPNAYRFHRMVVLPDWQGIGLAYVMQEAVASHYRAVNKRFFMTAAHPAVIRGLAASSQWRMVRKPGLVSRGDTKMKSLRKSRADTRFTASFEYVGPTATDRDAAMKLTGITL